MAERKEVEQTADKLTPALISVDWGTTNLRAMLLSEVGDVLASEFGEDGLQSASQDFSSTLLAKTGSWIDQDGTLPVLMSGMIGSRTGWIEAPYAGCPVSARSLASRLVRVEDFVQSDCWIVPGVRGQSVNGEPDIMRGEEVQIVGAVDWMQRQRGTVPGLMILPGSHNKWVELSNAVASRFSTTMSGEIFRLLSRHSILRQNISDNETQDWNVFAEGLKASAGAGGVFHHLFSVRTRNLLAEQQIDVGSSYMAGILIGDEIRSMLPLKPASETVCIVASPHLTELYSRAFRFFDIETCSVDSQTATIFGHLLVARAARILPPD